MATWEATARSFAGAQVRGPDDAADVVRAVFRHDACHRQVVLALDDQHRLVGFAGRAPEQSRRALVASHVIDVVREVGAGGAVAATLRPGEAVAPGPHEIEHFRALAGGCAAENVALFDWLVVIGHHWWSMRERSGGFRVDQPSSSSVAPTGDPWWTTSRQS